MMCNELNNVHVIFTNSGVRRFNNAKPYLGGFSKILEHSRPQKKAL